MLSKTVPSSYGFGKVVGEAPRDIVLIWAHAKLMGTPIRILYLIDEIESAAAGTERQIFQMIRALSQAGFQPELCVLRGTTWLTQEQAGCPVRVCQVDRVRSGRGIARLWQLTKWMKQQRFDLVQTFFPESNLMGPVLARLAGVRVILGSRRDLNYWMTGKFAMAQRVTNRFVTRLVANSQAVRDVIVRTEGVPLSKVEVLYNGIDLDRFKPWPEQRTRIRARLGLGETDVLIGNVSNLRPVKGVLLFAKAAVQVARESPVAHFLFVGEGPLRPQLEAMIHESGFSNRFHLVGRQQDVVPYLSACDAAVLSSESEGFSNSLLEYMATCLPTIATDVGGNREALGEEAGILVPPGDAGALAVAIQALVKDPEERARLSNSARERAIRLFNAQDYGPRLVNLYKRLLREHASAS